MFRKLLVSLPLVLLLVLSSSLLKGQNISGVVNAYAQVTNINANNITVASAAGFAAGDRVMLIQMKGATINTTNSAAYGNITALNDAGNYELATVSSIAGNVISLGSSPCQTYNTTGRVQLVRVFQATNATVTANLTCQPWNGFTGGVLALEISGTLTLNANIDVSGNGFRGGIVNSGGFSCNDALYVSGGNQGGAKGEGIAEFVAGQINSRGKQANGGGGANRGNSGAGGGSNGGTGGLGGFTYTGCSPGNQGIGGLTLTQSNGRAFLGGGGGGGFRDNGQTTAPGADGGGIAYIIAGTIAGNGNDILSNGATVTGITNDEGAGAGGGGGSILLSVGTYTGVLNLRANGGNGGNSFNNIFTTQCHGPGGGGSGGVVWFSQGATPAGVNVFSNGGTSGLVTNPTQPCFNQPHGATPGTAGVALYNLAPPLGATVFLGNDTIICAGDTLILNPGAYTSYLWSDASTNSTLEVTTTGQYAVTVTGGCGSAIDTINITLAPLPTPSLGNDTTICAGNSVTFNPGTFTTYLWQDNSAGPSLTGTTSGQYEVTVTDANGCSAADTAILTVNPLPTVNITGNTSYCQNDSTQLDAGPGFSSYAWNTSSSNQTIFATVPGNFSVTVTDANGCQNFDQVTVSINPLPPLNLGGNVTVCDGTPVTLDAGPGMTTYLWSDNSANQTLTPTTSGTYSVTITDGNGCQNIDSSTVVFNPNPVVFLGNDTSICTGSNIIFNAGPGFSNYLWSDNSTLQTFIAVQAGNYSVTVTDANGCQGIDDINLSLYVNPAPSLGSNFELCAGNVQLSPTGGPYSGYVWQDGSTNPTFNALGPGLYAVTVTDANGCQGLDDVLVVPGIATVDIGNDTIPCEGDPVMLSAGPLWTSVVWEDGTMGTFHTVSGVGVYSVTVVDTIGCIATDTMEITNEVPYPTPSFGPDTVLCVGTSLTVDAGPGDSYIWANGSTAQTQVIPATPGLYQVTVTVAPGCATVEGIIITQSLPLPQASLGNPVRFCAGDSAIFDVTNSTPASYLWNTGETSPSITTFTEGTYEVSVTNVCGTATASIDVLPLIFPPNPDLGPDTSVCEEIYQLDAGVVANSYLWGNGNISRYESAYHPGTYFVTATNQCGSGSDTISIVEQCEPALYFPSAFTPDGNGLNDAFGPVGENVEDYDMTIYDRWGKLIFRSQSQNDWWDGTIGGQPVQEGVYVWRASYQYTYRGETKVLNLKGTITLIR